MRNLILLAFGILAFFSYGIYLYFFQLDALRGELEPEHPPGYYDYKGITHAHSNLSIGSGTPEKMIEVAKDLQLDFLFFTELNLSRRPLELEGYRGRLLILTAGEYSHVDSRLMYYGAPPDRPPDTKGQAQLFFTDLISQKKRSPESGFIVLAHPFLSSYQGRDYPEGLNGIEVINLKKVLEDAWADSKISSLRSMIVYPFNPQLALLFLFENPREEIQIWDSLNQKIRVSGFLGTDATAKAIIFDGTHIEFPSYETAFSVASNHVLLRSELTGDSANDRAKILEALRLGQFYMSLDLLAPPKGFFAEIRTDGKAYPLGSEVVLKTESHLYVRLPLGLQVPFETVIYRNGEVYFTSNNNETNLLIQEKGVYRIVVRLIPSFPIPFGKRWVPWIYTNNFYIL